MKRYRLPLSIAQWHKPLCPVLTAHRVDSEAGDGELVVFQVWPSRARLLAALKRQLARSQEQGDWVACVPATLREQVSMSQSRGEA